MSSKVANRLLSTLTLPLHSPSALAHCSRISTPDSKSFIPSGVQPLKILKEFDLSNADSLEVGQVIGCDVFAADDFVDVTGTTKGRGFSGVIKRWNFRRLKETHGVGPVHREVGSLGANSTPSRVFPGRKLPGQYGVEQVTVLNLKVVKVDKEKGVLLIKGAIPGPKGSVVYVRDAVKKS